MNYQADQLFLAIYIFFFWLSLNLIKNCFCFLTWVYGIFDVAQIIHATRIPTFSLDAPTVKSEKKITFLISNNISSSPLRIIETKTNANTTIKPKDPLSISILKNYPISISFIVQDQKDGSAGLQFRLKDEVFYFWVSLSQGEIRVKLSTASFTDAASNVDSSKVDLKTPNLDISAGFTGNVGYLTVNSLWVPTMIPSTISSNMSSLSYLTCVYYHQNTDMDHHEILTFPWFY